jgi:hypothetical protein
LAQQQCLDFPMARMSRSLSLVVMEASRAHILLRLPSRLAPHQAAHLGSWATQLRWFGAATIVSFAVPFIFSSWLGLQHDVYLGIYFVIVLAGFTAYALATRLDVRATIRRHWKLGVALGLVFGFALVQNVLSEKATPHPHGVYYVFELAWRGAIYGAIDALLLTVLPCLVVYRALGGELATWRRRVTYVSVSLALIMTITGVYHLGYAQYRHDGISQPETGNALISMPMLLSTNPIGSIADHMAMHISAVAQSYGTTVRLPPPTKAR